MILGIVVNETRQYWLVRSMRDHFDEIYVLASRPAATYAGAGGEEMRVDFYWMWSARRSSYRNHANDKKDTRP